MEKNNGKVREICQSENVGTMMICTATFVNSKVFMLKTDKRLHV